VLGDVDAFDVIEAAAFATNIVIRGKCYVSSVPNTSLLILSIADSRDINHPSCAVAILAGLQKKTTASFLIYLPGTGCISDDKEQTWDGNYNPHV
jgi:hypothetical protein